NSSGPWDVYTQQTLLSLVQARPDILILSPCSLTAQLPVGDASSRNTGLHAYSHKLLQLADTLRDFQRTSTRVFCWVWPPFPCMLFWDVAHTTTALFDK